MSGPHLTGRLLLPSDGPIVMFSKPVIKSVAGGLVMPGHCTAKPGPPTGTAAPPPYSITPTPYGALVPNVTGVWQVLAVQNSDRTTE